jgi:hypothetical protein
MASTEVTAYAAKSFKERFITAILEREDVGYTRWTPAAVYAIVRERHPDLYPESPPIGWLNEYASPDFMEELAKYRLQRRLSQLPVAMLSDTIGRRILDLAFPVLVHRLDRNPAELMLMDTGELRKLIKDAIGFLSANETRGGLAGKKSEDEEKTGLDYNQAIALMARVSPDRREIIAKALAAEFMAAASQEAQVIDVEPEDANV